MKKQIHERGRKILEPQKGKQTIGGDSLRIY